MQPALGIREKWSNSNVYVYDAYTIHTFLCVTVEAAYRPPPSSTVLMAEEIRKIGALLDQPLSEKDQELITYVKHKFSTDFKKGERVTLLGYCTTSPYFIKSHWSEWMKCNAMNHYRLLPHFSLCFPRPQLLL